MRETETERQRASTVSPVLEKILRICVDSPRNKGKINTDYGGYLVNQFVIFKPLFFN